LQTDRASAGEAVKDAIPNMATAMAKDDIRSNFMWTPIPNCFFAVNTGAQKIDDLPKKRQLHSWEVL